LPPHTLKAPDVDIVAVLLEFGADPNELDWEGTSPLKDALDAALRRLHWHMGKRERELQKKFADICSRLVSRSGASGCATVIELPYGVSGPSGRDLENISSREKKKKKSRRSLDIPYHSLILHIFREEKQNLLMKLRVVVRSIQLHPPERDAPPQRRPSPTEN
jgi:hypothetical protein